MNRHPSKDIVGTESGELLGKRVVLCVTGSVAAVRSPAIARELMRHGAEVYGVLSKSAQNIIHPNLIEWATGNPAVTVLTGKIEHVALVGEHSEKADLVLIAPATANTIGKIAAGIDDTTVTSVASTALGSKTPIMIVPAMHHSMYRSPVVEGNIKRLRKYNIEFVGPKIEEGKAKIAETDDIVQTVIRRLEATQDFLGKRFLITSGSTIEYLDAVRVVTNRSSGKMGAAIAEEAVKRGAQVTVVYGVGSASISSKASVLNVETTEEMRRTVLKELKGKRYDFVVAAAAVSDWTSTKKYKGKVSTRRATPLTLSLKPTLKIVDEIGKTWPEIFLVVFRADYNVDNEKLVENAYKRLKQANADLAVANDVSRKGVGFKTETNEVFIVDRKKNVIHVPLCSKRLVAKRVLDSIKESAEKADR